MDKLLKVAAYEYKRHVGRPRFWIALFALPLGMLLLMGISAFFSISSADKRPIGLIDHSGIIKTLPANKESGFFDDPNTNFIRYENDTDARAALDSGEIQAYLSVPAEYSFSYKVDYTFQKPITSTIQNSISTLLRDNLLADQTIPNREALNRQTEFTFVTLDGSRTSSSADFLKIFLPVITGMIFFITVMMSGTYLMQALVEEKENRTMEIMITSTSPNQLIGGKIIGNMGVGLTQLVVWSVAAGLIMLIFRDKLGFLSQLQLDWSFIVVSIIFMLLGYLCICALMAMLGATVTNTQESQQITGLVVLPMMLPFYLMYFFISNPNGLIPRLLTFFPLSSPIAIGMRMAFGSVTTWEIIVSAVILLIAGVLSVLLAARVFKLGMLTFDQKIPLTKIFKKAAFNE